MFNPSLLLGMAFIPIEIEIISLKTSCQFKLTNPDIDNCEYEGILGTIAGIIGTIQANEVVKEILGIGETLCGYVLIIDALKLTFRKVKLNKRSDCYCNEKK